MRTHPSTIPARDAQQVQEGPGAPGLHINPRADAGRASFLKPGVSPARAPVRRRGVRCKVVTGHGQLRTGKPHGVTPCLSAGCGGVSTAGASGFSDEVDESSVLLAHAPGSGKTVVDHLVGPGAEAGVVLDASWRSTDQARAACDPSADDQAGGLLGHERGRRTGPVVRSTRQLSRVDQPAHRPSEELPDEFPLLTSRHSRSRSVRGSCPWAIRDSGSPASSCSRCSALFPG